MNGGNAYSHSSMWEQYCQESVKLPEILIHFYKYYINEWINSNLILRCNLNENP